LPSKRSNDGYERVIKRRPVIFTAGEKVENKRDIEGQASRFQGELDLVLVIDASVEISRFRVP
jgi:hypothetical protein